LNAPRADFALKHFVAGIPPARQRLIVTPNEFRTRLKRRIQFCNAVLVAHRRFEADVRDNAHRLILALCSFLAAQGDPIGEGRLRGY
jgi:hypothetical protein